MNTLHPSFSSSQALSLEIAGALLADTAVGWTNRRWLADTGKNFREVFCSGSGERDHLQRQLLTAFAVSLKGMRILSLGREVLFRNGDEYSEALPVLRSQVYLGCGRDPAVILYVNQYEPSGTSFFGIPQNKIAHWSVYQPSPFNFVECGFHSDKEFEGKIILGRLAGRSCSL